jgi:hypothetical protein
MNEKEGEKKIINSNGAKMQKTWTDGVRLVYNFFFLLNVWYFFYYFLFLINIFERICKRERERKIHREKLTWNREILSINATLEWFPFRPSVMMSPFFFFYFLLGKKEKEKKGRLDYPAYNTVFLPAGFSSFYFIFFSSASSSSCCV